ncbi:MAG TPA: TRAP transporter large permease subunit [Candidatus Marinimicrobia bacterium]|jgi:tripartite ATP-independent transporter DctM subunit|nr:TRAP transporter large permease subunit [Candidatus Neomarinimicrobiota bacterium]HOO14854.1 TRAP transporter large permease subunit [Candidatus Neomarinimicrobiota bacterium]HQC61631.1 TRAP transporter large permease subunit [Candidatus Neomarinimicrobiota bacterium]
MALLFLVLIVVLILCGLPLFAAIGITGIIQFAISGIDPTVVIVEMYRVASAPTLLAIPLFTLAGYVLAESSAPRRLLNLAEALLGWIPGGVAIGSLVTCALFTCFTGASGITIIALGGLILPILLKNNYSEKFALGLITSSGSLGLLFPPSLPLILYGVVASVSIDQLFIAGLIPGILLIVLLSIYAVRNDVLKKSERIPFSWQNLGRALKETVWELPIPVIILGGIYGGFITAVEASAVTAFYVLIAEFILNRDLSFRRDLIRIMRDSVQLVGGILIILSCSMGATAYLIDAEIPQKALLWAQQVFSSKITFLLVLNIFLLITGMMLDIFSAIIIVVPLIVPIALSYGINPVHLGIIFLTNLEIGYLTPPIGLNLFISSYRFDKSITELYRISLPFLFIMLIALVLITYIPDLSLFLVGLIQ